MALHSQTVTVTWPGAAALAALVLAAGCGGGGDRETRERGGPRTGAPAATADPNVEAELARQVGVEQCSFYPLKDLAKLYGTKPTPEAVAKAIGAQTEGTTAVKDAARRGCLEALKTTEK